MKFRVLDTFRADYQRLPQQIQQRVDKSLRLLEQNPRHPSLRTKRIKGTKNVWEARATIAYRFTFNWDADVVTLRRVGTHDILREERK